MEELELMLQNGIIDATTYQKLKQRLTSSELEQGRKQNESAVRDVEKYVSKERSLGLGDVSVGGSTTGNIYMDQDELDTYTSRGIAPTAGVDYRNIRAERQTWQDQLANGVTKFAGKTATGVAGGLAMIPTLAIVVLGQLTDMVSPYDNFQFKDIYDNGFQRMMDSANESMDSALPNYVSNAQREASVWNSMGTMNFWANDLLGGASFVASALLTEYLSAGMATPLALTRVSKLLKTASTADDMATINRYAERFSGLVKTDRALKFGRQIATGAGYEAGVEARHFVDQAKDQYINDYIEQYGHEPTEEQLAIAMDDIHSVGNGVFGVNLGLVSLGNMITLPKTFAPGLASKFGFKAGKVKDADWVVKPSELTDTQLARMSKKTGKSIDELKATDYVNKWDGLSKVERLARAGKGRFAPMVTEGFFEEGFQGVTQNAALDYISNRFNVDNIGEVANLSESIIRGFEEQYDVGKAEGWKEIIIGSILGGVGAPNIGAGKGQPIWQGGVFGYQSPGKRENIQNLIGDAIKYGKATTENIKHAATVAGITKKQDDAIKQGNMFDAKNQEYASMYSYVSTMVKLGRFDEIDSEVSKMVEGMTTEEFAEQFGYVNKTEEELSKRKAEVISKFKNRADDIREARELADRISIYEDDEDLKDGLGYVLGISKNIDEREMQMFKSLQEKLGKIYSTDEVKQMASYVNFQRTTDGKDLKEYGDKAREKNKKVAELEKLTKEELTQNKNRTSKSIMERGKKLDTLTNEIAVLENTINSIEERLNRQYTEYLKANGILTEGGEFIEYTRDKQAFKQDFELFRRVQKDVTDAVGEDFYNRPDIKPVLDDLMKLATYRQQQITLANYYMGKKGQTKLADEIANLKKMAEEELVSDELDKTTQVFQEQQRQLDNMQRVAAEAYKANAQRVHGTAYVIKERAKIVSQLNDAINDVKDPELKATVEDLISKLQGFILTFNLEKDDAAKLKVATDALGYVEFVKQILNSLKESAKPEQVAEIDAFLSGEKFNTIIKQFQDFVKNYKKEDGKDENLSSYPRVADPSSLTVMIQNYISPDGKALLADKSAEDILNNLVIRVLELPDDGQGMVNLKDAEKNKFDSKVMLQRGLVGMSNFGLAIYYKDGPSAGVHIGNILDPNRFRFKDEDGNYVDFNVENPEEHLELLNPSFVTTDKDGNKIVTRDGKLFIDNYVQGVNAFNEIKEQIKEGKREFSNAEVDQLFDVKAIFTGLSRFEESNTEKLSEWSSLKDGKLQTDLSKYNGEGKGILIFYNLKNEANFYLYNPDTKQLKSLNEDTALNLSLIENFYSGAAKKDVDSSPGKLKIIYKFNDNIKSITLKQPEVDPDFNVSNLIIDKLFETSDKVKEEQARRKEGEEKQTVNGWDTNELLFFTAEGTDKQFSISVTGVGSGEKSIERNGSALNLKIYTPGTKKGESGKTDTITLTSTDDKFDEKSTAYSGFNLRRLSNGSTVLEYNKKVIKNNVDFLNALNNYIKDKTTAYLKKEESGEEIKNFFEKVGANLFQNKIVDGKLVKKPVQLLRINQNFDKNMLESSINDFTPLRNPTVTYFFDGKPVKYEDTKFSKVLTEFRKSLKNASNLGVNGLNELKSVVKDAYEQLSSTAQAQNKVPYERMLKNIDEEIKKKEKEQPKEETEQKQPEPPPGPQSIDDITKSIFGTDPLPPGEGRKDEESSDDSEGYDDSPYFATNEIVSTEKVNLEEVRERLKQILPDSINVKFIDEFVDALANNTITYGVFKNAVIYLGKKVPKGVEYHEAFHAVFRTLLTEAQRVKVLQEAVTRYGKPTSEQLDQLKSLSDKYAKLSLRQLTNLWYEEKLADEFMDIMNGDKELPKEKSFLQKILDFLKSIVNLFKSGDAETLSEIDALFKSIKGGQFKNAKTLDIIDDNLSVFSSLKYASSNDTGKPIAKYQDSYLNTRLTNKVFYKAYQKLKNQGYVTDADILDAINVIANDYKQIYLEVIQQDKFSRYGSGLHSKEQDAIQLYNIIRSISSINEPNEAIKNLSDKLREENIAKIIKTVRQNIDTIKFDDYDVESEEFEDDAPTELAQKPNQRVGGMSSTTKEFRRYIMFTELPIDEFNFGIPEEILKSDPKYINYVNGVKLYNSLERMLVNTEREDLLKKLYYIKEGQPQMEAFYSRLVKDIYKELDLPMVGNYEKDITEMSINDLKDSSKFCLFTACLTKHKLESVVNIVDPDTGQSKVFIANVNDARKTQRENWFTNWKILGLDNKKDEVISTLNLILKTIANTDANAKYLFSNFNQAVADVKRQFNEIGITLSDKYIQLSLFKIINDKYPDLNIENESQFKSLNEIVKIYKDIQYITEDNVRGILNSISVDGDPYSNKKELQKFISNKIQLTEQEEDALGAKGRINDIAGGNAMFDESVSPSTIRNVDNEMVYIHLYPNYISTLLLKIRNSYPALLSAIDADTFEEGLDSFRTFLNNNNLYLENPESTELIENFFRTLYNNPILNDKHLNGELRETYLKNLTAYLLDGLKQQSMDDDGNAVSYKGSKASQYAALDKRGKFIMMLNLFAKTDRNSLAKTITIGTENFDTYSLIAFQNEGKNTQYAFNVIKRNFVDSTGALSDLGKEYLQMMFKTEADNIRTEYLRMLSGEGSLKDFNENNGVKIGDVSYSKQEVIDILKNTSDPNFMKVASKFRALSFVEFDLLKVYSPELYESLLKSVVKGEAIPELSKVVETTAALGFNNFLNELSSLDTNVISKSKDGTYVSVTLPQDYIDPNGKVDMKKLKDFFFNNWINASTINNLMFGNINTGLKNSVDLFKRYAGPNAAGPALGFGDLRLAIVEDEFFNYTNPATGKVDKNIERTNAQSYGTLDWYYNNYLKTFSKVNPEIDRIYRKIRMMYELTGKERDTLDKYGALLNPRKTSLFNAFIYGKTSTDIIDRNEVSYVEESKLPEFRKAIDDLLKTKDKDDYHAKLIAIQSYYKPYPKSVALHNKLNEMEQTKTDIIIFPSAVKTNKQNITKWNEPLKPVVVSNDFFREQVVTDNMKTEIIHGTQMMQLIYSEHNDNTIVKLKGKEGEYQEYSVGTLRKLYRKLLGDRLFRTYGELRKAVLNPDGSTNFKSLLKSFKQSLIEQGGDPTLLELFDGVGEKSNYNLNLPRILSLYENMFLSFMGKGTFSQKVPGHKFTLVTDFGNGVMEQDGKIVTDKEYRTNPSKYEKVSVRDLEFKYDAEKNAWYGECKIPMQLAETIGLKVGDELPQEFLELVGVRIPTQDKHSMVYLKVVDVLPAQKGNKIIMPKEVLILSGADFDIDSEFARTVSYYASKDAQGKSHLNIYGSYLEKDAPERRIKYAYFDFREETLNSKAVKIILKDTKENDVELVNLQRSIDTVSNDIKELRRQLYEEKKLSFDLDNDINAAIEADEFTFDSSLVKLSESLKENISYYKEDIQKFLQDKKELLEQKKKRIKELENKVLKEKGYPTDVESFKSYRIDGKATAETIVENNYNNFNKINGGSIDRIQPITIGELNNLLFNIEKVLINNGNLTKNNEGNHGIAQTPASRDAAVDFIEKYYDTGIFKDPVNVIEYSTPTAVVKMAEANSIGKENIGIAAIGNIVFQYLKNANILVEGGINVKIDSYTNDQQQRINDLISTIISMAVDNAKEQDAIRFNITPATQGAFMFMIMTKKGFEYTSLIHLQDSVLRFSQMFANNSSPIKPKKEKDDSDLDDLAKLLVEYSTNIDVEELVVKYGPLTIEMLVEAKKYSENKETSTLTEEQFKYINYMSLSEFQTYKDVSQNSTGFSQFVSLVKGLRTEIAETENIARKLDTIGLEIVKREGTDGNNFDDYSLRHTDKYIEYINSVRALEAPNMKYPIDYLEVIKADPFLMNQIKAYALFMNDSSKFFLAQTPKAKKLINRLSESLKTNYLNNIDNYNKLVKLITAYYGNKASLHKLTKDSKLSPVIKEMLTNYDISEMVTLSGEEEMPQIISLLTELITVPELASNKFLRMLEFDKIIYDDKSKAGFKNRNVYTVISNSYIRLSPEEQQRVTSDFEMLKLPQSITNDKLLQEKISLFRILLSKHLIMKDLSMYRNNSYVSFLPPSFFAPVSEGLDLAQSALEGKLKYEDVFGVSEDEFNRDFVERYCRDINNTFDLKSQRSDIVFNQIKNGYLRLLGELSPEDVASLKKTKLGEKIIELSNLVKSSATETEIKEIIKELRENDLLPLKYTSPNKEKGTPAKLEVSIFSNIGVDKDDVDPASYNPVMVNANKEALFSTRLFGIELVKKGKKYYKNVIFPEFIVFNFKDSKGNSNYKVLKRKKLFNKNIESKNPNAGFKAEYEEVTRIGSKQLLPYMLTLAQLEDAAKGTMPEEIDFELTAEDFDERFGTPETKVQNTDEIIKKVKELSLTQKVVKYVTEKDIFTNKEVKVPITEPYPVTEERLKNLKNYLLSLNINSDFNKYVQELTTKFFNKNENRTSLIDRVKSELNKSKEKVETKKTEIKVTTIKTEELYNLNKQYFQEKLKLTLEQVKKIYGENLSSDKLTTLLKMAKDIGYTLSTSKQQVSTSTTTLDYKTMSQKELESIFEKHKDKLASKYKITNLLDFFASIKNPAYSNEIIQMMLDSCM